MGQNVTANSALNSKYNYFMYTGVFSQKNESLECDCLTYTFFLITKVTPRQQLTSLCFSLLIDLSCDSSVTHVDTL